MPGTTRRNLVRTAGVSGLLLLTLVGSAQAADTVTNPYPGVRHTYRTTSTPNRIHVVTVDLGRATLRVRATRSEDRAQTASDFAGQYGCQVAVNGDFFSYTGYPTIGLAVGRGERWPGSADGSGEGFVAVGRDNHAEISAPATVVNPPEDWMSEVVSGKPLIVAGGVALTTACASHYCERHPRTGVGISQDGQTLILATIDGRSSVSAGATTRELGGLMAELGAWRAINLDGGGSTTMYIAGEGGVVNRPSDGSERVVANHLGIAVVAPEGTLKGFVRDTDITDPDANLVGAQVTLATGATATTGATGLYTFTDVPVGDVTVTAEHPGYGSASRTVYVSAGDTTWGSIALTLAPDAAPGGTDAALGGPDAGDAGAGDPGGCRVATGRAGTGWLWLLVVAAGLGGAHSRRQLRWRGGRRPGQVEGKTTS